MKNNNKLIEYLRVVSLFALLLAFASSSAMAQCFATFSWGSGTLDNNSTTPVLLANCAFSDEYSPITVNSTGDYEFTSSVTTDFLTITDGSNTVITSGITPVTATISSTGSYRVHVHSDALCGAAVGCRDLFGQFVGGGSPPPPPSAGVYNFHPAGAVGRFGPTQAQVNTAYTGTSLDGEVTVTGSGIQNWVVPISGIYEIEALGAQGGGITGGSALNANGTEGARVQGEFVLTQGDTIKILVGQRAGTGLGGGGGSFVIAPPYTDTTSILAIAGGGGSEGSIGTPNLPPSESEGRSVRSGGTFSDITRAQAGQGGNVDTPNGGGGGGFLTDGGGTGGSGQSFLNGGVGANGQNGSYRGGFGGGGARNGSWGAGGGGGYSGGAASGSSSPRRAGGGGGSFNAGTNQINQAGVNTGDGEVRIELLVPLLAQDDAGVASIDSPGVFCPGPQDVVVTIQNYGINQITSVDVNWEVDGVPQTTFNFTGVLDTVGGTGSNTAQINLGSFNFTNAAYNVVAWTSNPNNTADTTTFNDTASAVLQSNLPAPTGLSAANVTTNTADLSWTPGDPSNNFMYDIVPLGGTPGTGTFVSSSTVTATGLQAITDYEFYVREICANGQDTSAWSAPEPFNTICPGTLTGTYVVGSSSSADFPTFTAAVRALEVCGVSGPVVFDVEAGTYNEQIVIEDYTGVSATNNVTFKGAGAANTVLTYEQNQSDDRYTVRFDGSSYITFDSLTVEAQSSGTYGWVVHITDNTSDITMKNCSLLTDGNSTSTFVEGVIVSGSNTSYTTGASGVSNITLEDNYILGGYNGIRFNGNFGNEVQNVIIEGNHLDDSYYYGIYLLRNDGVTIENNTVDVQSTGTDFSAAIYFSSTDDYQIIGNTLRGMGRYGIYNTNGGGTSTNRSVIVNNAIGGGFRNNSTLTSGIRILNTSSQYIDIVHNSINVDQPSGRALNVSNTSPSNLRIWNNNLAHTPGSGTGYALYVSSTNSIEDIDYNNYYSDGSNFVYYGSARADLATLQGVNTPANNDANSVSADPLFLAPDNLLPLSSAIDNEGLGIPQVPVDINGNPRDPNNPSIGAYEFTAPNGDVSLDEVRLSASECLGSNDSIYFEVTNNLGSTIDFSNDPLNFTWEVNGPVNSNGTITINSGSLAVGNSAEFGGDGVDMSVPGNYVITLAYIDTNAVNDVTANDTLINSFNIDVSPLLAVSPKIDTVFNTMDTVDLTAESPFFPGGDFFITEICHYKLNNTTPVGGPVTGWPSWLIADDYIEITGVPNSDLAGYTLEQWQATQNGTYTFPVGTVMGPNGTAILAVGQLGASVPSPSDYYYHANGTYTGSYGSSTSAGRILFDPSMNIVDAVGYNNYTFPAAANVPASEWSNPIAGGGSTAGIRLTGPDDNTGNNWVVTDGVNHFQDPNVVNSGVTVPVPGNLTGFSWNFQSAVIDTNIETTVGPYTVPGIYEYIAEYAGTPCGTLYDTATIVVSFTDISLQSSSDISCNGFADGEIVISIDGGQSPFTIDWSDDPARTTTTASGLAAGTYSVTVTDVNNISDSLSVTITEPAAPLSGNLTTQNSSCGLSDGQLSIAVSGGTTPYSYTWSTGGSAATETGLAGGTPSTVTVTDANGCTLTESGIVFDAAAPTLALNIDQMIDCAGDATGEVSSTVTGGSSPFNYSWSNNATTADLTGLTAGSYDLTVTDSANCVAVASVNLTEPDSLELTSAIINDVTCNGAANGSIQITVAGGVQPYSYNWSNNSNSPSISGLAPGSYSGTVTDANGCQVVGGPVTITEPSAPLTASVTNTVNVSCNGGSDGEGTVSASGGTSPYTFTWSNAATGATQTGLSAGSYIVTITDDNNCQTLQSVNISQPSALQSVVLTSTNVSCNGGNDGTATAVAQGGTAPYTYTWSGSAGTGAMVTGLSQGTYTVTATDDNGCTSTSTVIIDEPTALSASISATTDVTCFGANNGTATVTASGGTPGYSYAWSNNQGNPTATGLGAGSFSVTVTDANGCNVNVSATITEPSALQASLNTTHVSCNGGSDGELEAVVSGGTSPYSYNWSNGDTAGTADSLASGLYLVTISDANGCNTILSNFVNEPSALTASVNISSEITCNGETDGAAMVNAQGGTAPYSYAWSNGDSTMNATDLGVGTVHVTVTDDNGCMVEDSVTLSQPDVLSVMIENTDDATCFGYADGRGEAMAQGGTTPYTYSWTSGTATATVNNLAAGTNEVTVTDANGCSATATVEIEQPEQIDTSLMVEYGGALIANLEGSDVTYQWWDCDAGEIVEGANGQYFEPEANGSFALIINEAGCQDTSDCFTLTNVSTGGLVTEENAFEVYPNPNRGHFNVRLTGNSESPVQLDLMDMQGKQLLSRNIGRLSGELVEELNINLAAGVYFVKVIRDGEMSIKRVVVQ